MLVLQCYFAWYFECCAMSSVCVFDVATVFVVISK